MQIDGGTFVGVALPVISAIVWLVRLEGRINLTQAQFLEIIRRLDRIEHKQDLEERT